MKSPRNNYFVILGLLLLFLRTNSLHANVYATDIKVNGSLTKQACAPRSAI